jgi:hypothetical protein
MTVVDAFAIHAMRTFGTGRRAARVNTPASFVVALKGVLADESVALTARIDTDAFATDLRTLADHTETGIDAVSETARQAVGAYNVVTATHAMSSLADLMTLAVDVDAELLDTKPRLAIADEAEGAGELVAELAVRDTAAVVADLVGTSTDRVVVERSVAVVVETVAPLDFRLIELRTFEHLAHALGNTVLTDTLKPRVTLGATASTIDAADARDEVGEVVRGDVEQVFPCEVELVVPNVAVINQKVDVRLIA